MKEIVTLLGLLAATGGWLRYLSLIPREKVPRNPRAFSAVMIGAGVLSLASLSPVVTGQGAMKPLLLASTALTVVLSSFFFVLLAQAPMPDGDIRCAVSEPLPSFEAMDSEGNTFSSDSLIGGAVLLKFFRGHW